MTEMKQVNKIYRIQTECGRIVYAESSDAKAFYLLDGLFPDLVRTGEQLASVRILAPILPPVIYVVGYNYSGNPLQARQEIGETPVIVMKAQSTVIGPGEPIVLPRKLCSDKVDYEGELAVVIGKHAKNVSRAQAADFIYGYTVANDVTARDIQKGGAGGQWVRGKNFDSFCPLGPAIVKAEDLDSEPFKIRTWVDGELRQDDLTSSMIFGICEIIEYLSASNTLLPGTVILTGTPAGTGVKMDPPSFLIAGNQVAVEVSGVGRLENPVIEERFIESHSHE